MLLVSRGASSRSPSEADPAVATWVKPLAQCRDGELILVNRAVSFGATPLMTACESGHDSVAKMLLESKKGVDVNAATPDGSHTALYLACARGHAEVVRVLLADNSIDVNAAVSAPFGGMTSLYLASWHGFSNIVSMLLRSGRGIDVNKCRENGWSPLYIARECGHVSIVKMLRIFNAVESLVYNNSDEYVRGVPYPKSILIRHKDTSKPSSFRSVAQSSDSGRIGLNLDLA